MTYVFDKEPLGRGWSYPLPRSTLDAALVEGGITDVHEIGYLRPRASPVAGTVLTAFHAGVEPAWPHVFLPPHAAALRLYAVRSPECRATERLLVEVGLPKLVAWLGLRVTRPETWRSEPHTLRFTLSGGAIDAVEVP